MSERRDHNDERMKELKAFDDTKLGVKGLVDAGIVKIPKMFVRPCHEDSERGQKSHARVPVIDLHGLLDCDRRKFIVGEIRRASEDWGVFQVVNHGIPIAVLESTIKAIRGFNEGDIVAKKEFYGRDPKRRVNFNSNYDLFQSETVGWRDSLLVSMTDSNLIEPQALPSTCRATTIEFINHIKELGNKLFELLSEGLGLKSEHLRSMDCNEGKLLACHYYPECPEPDLAIGVAKHSDNSFITILAQDQTGGLQALHQNQYWVDVEPIPGALIVNIGDFLQLVSNDKFKSNVHRVVPSHRSRVSMVFFFLGHIAPPGRLYGPIKELTSDEDPPKYREALLSDRLDKFFSIGLHEKPGLDEYRL